MSHPWASTARPAGLIAMALAASLVGIWLGEAVTESWFLALSVLVGIALGSLGLLMVGHLLGDIWLEPVRAELEAASLTMPLLAVLALPLAFGLEQLYPWATDSFVAKAVPPVRRALYEPSAFVLRGAVYLACWTGLALWIARPGSHRAASAVGLVLISVTTSLAAVDWFMSREPLFWSTLYGFAFAVSQLLAALAGAIAIALLRPGHPEAERLRSLERVLLTLAILALWVWFAQYIVIWLANLPDEAAWYLARADWAWLKGGFVLPVLVAAILIMVPTGASRPQMLAASCLVLAQHVGHMVWLIRPASQGETSLVTDGFVAAALAFVAALWLATALRSRRRAPADQRAELSPRGASGSEGAFG